MAKYTADQLKAMGGKGQAFKNPDGSFSYPIGDADDLANAVRAVGRGGADHDAIRKYVVGRAKSLGLTSKIPDNWNSDGSLRSGPTLDVERRFTPGVVELRAIGDQKAIGGYAAVFGKLSRNLGGFVEQVTPTTFNESRMAGWPDAIARYNHDDMMLLGTTAAGTLRLNTDDNGLDYKVLPPQSRSDILELVERGDLRHSSFAFRCDAGGDEWGVTDQGYPMRSLLSAKLIDVAPVVSPAYPDATTGLRSLAAAMSADPDEVRNLAEQDELRRFFARTDGDSTKTPAKRIFGPAALAQLRAKARDLPL